MTHVLLKSFNKCFCCIHIVQSSTCMIDGLVSVSSIKKWIFECGMRAHLAQCPQLMAFAWKLKFRILRIRIIRNTFCNSDSFDKYPLIYFMSYFLIFEPEKITDHLELISEMSFLWIWFYMTLKLWTYVAMLPCLNEPKIEKYIFYEMWPRTGSPVISYNFRSYMINNLSSHSMPNKNISNIDGLTCSDSNLGMNSVWCFRMNRVKQNLQQKIFQWKYGFTKRIFQKWKIRMWFYFAEVTA